MKATRLAAAAAVLTTTAVLGIIGFPASAGAATPNGGALNMVNDQRVPGGIENAWAASDDSGFQGMWCAVDVTNGWTDTPVSPGDCFEGFSKP